MRRRHTALRQGQASKAARQGGWSRGSPTFPTRRPWTPRLPRSPGGVGACAVPGVGLSPAGSPGHGPVWVPVAGLLAAGGAGDATGRVLVAAWRRPSPSAWLWRVQRQAGRPRVAVGADPNHPRDIAARGSHDGVVAAGRPMGGGHLTPVLPHPAPRLTGRVSAHRQTTGERYPCRSRPVPGVPRTCRWRRDGSHTRCLLHRSRP